MRTAAGNMCGTVMRGTVAPPESETSSSRQGSCRNLGDLMLPAVATAIPGHDRKSYGRRCRGRYEESDGCIVPMKPRTTPADRLVAESVEGRRPVEGRARANACSGPRAGIGMSPTASAHGPELEPKPRMRLTFDRSPVRDTEGAAKQKPHAGICAGAAGNCCPLYVARCPAGDHIRWTARKAVSLRCPFGDRTRAVDPAPLFHAPLFSPDGILGRAAAQILCTRSLDAERLLCTDPMRRTVA